MPTISVVLATYAGEIAANLDEAIGSVISQSRIPDEILILLDGPVPKDQHNVIKKYLESYPGLVRVVGLRECVGRGAARNRGVIESKGDLIAIMDSDDLAYPDRLEKQEQFIKQKAVDIVVGWQSEFVGVPSNIVAIKKCPVTHEGVVRSLKFRCRISNPSILFTREIFVKTGGYGDFSQINEDHDFFVKIAEEGGEFGVIPSPLVNVRITQAQRKRRGLNVLADDFGFRYSLYRRGYYSFLEFVYYFICVTAFRVMPVSVKNLFYKISR